MEDPGHEAEDTHRDQQPQRPDDQIRTARVGSSGPADQYECHGSEDQAGRDEPGDLTALRGFEHPQPAGLAPRAAPASGATRSTAHALHRVSPTTGDDGAGLVAVEPAQAVVAEGQLEDRVVLRATDVRTRRRGPQLDGENPPAGADDHRAERGEQLSDPAQPTARPEGEVGDRQRRHDQHDLELLGEESESDEHAGQNQPSPPSVLESLHHRPDRGDHQQDEQRLGVVEAEHHRRDRCHREGHPRDDAGPVAEVLPGDHVEQRHRGDAHQRLGHQDRPRVDPEDPGAEPRNPQRGRRFVDRDGVRHVRRPEEPRLPRLGAGLDGSRVEGVGPPVDRQVPQVGHRGADQ